MSRSKKRTNYDAERIMNEFMNSMVGAFGEYDDRTVDHSTVDLREYG